MFVFFFSQREFVERLKNFQAGEKNAIPMLASACPGENDDYKKEEKYYNKIREKKTLSSISIVFKCGGWNYFTSFTIGKKVHLQTCVVV